MADNPCINKHYTIDQDKLVSSQSSKKRKFMKYLNSKKIETVFDHNITDEEWKKVRGMSSNLYLSTIDQETAFYDIAALFYLRGDKKKTGEYANKLSPDRRNDLWRILTHP